MSALFLKLQAWLRLVLATDCPHDPLARMSARELADLPVTHPHRDETCSC